MQETWVPSLDQEDPLEKGMTTPQTEEPGRLQSTGSQRVRHNRETNTRATLWNLQLVHFLPAIHEVNSCSFRKERRSR